MSTSSYFQIASADKFVTVWPCLTGEPGWYDVTFGQSSAVLHCEDQCMGRHHVDTCSIRTVHRVTASEVAGYAFTEVGAPYKMTVADMVRRVEAWRAEYDAMLDEAYDRVSSAR